MKTSRAIGAGIVGALVMTTMGWMARTFMGMPVNLEMMLGTMFGLPEGGSAWMLGFGVHLIAGVIFALIYAWCFEHFSHRAGLWTGVANKVIPGTLDKYLATEAFDGQQTDEPQNPDQPFNLWEPVPDDHGAHGKFDQEDAPRARSSGPRRIGHGSARWASASRVSASGMR